MDLSPFLKQLYVALPPFLAGISAGGTISYPTVLLQQLKQNDSTIQLDFDTASWMGSIHGIASIPSIFILSLMQSRGRKFGLILVYIIISIGWILAYFASSATVLLISESFHGFGSSSLLIVTCMTITEMVAPKYRDAFMHIFYIIETLTMAIEVLLIQYCHWRTIACIMPMPLIISVLMTCALPESPYWLAYKGNMSKCEKNFLWLRGSDADSKKEMQAITEGAFVDSTAIDLVSIKQVWKTIVQKDFYIPALHVCVLQIVVYGSGSIVVLVYAIVILRKVTEDEHISSYGGFIISLLLCLGMCFGILLDKYFKKKPVLLCSILGVILSLIVGSTFYYLQTINVWPRDSLVGLYCLSSFILCSSISILSSAYSIAAALMPVKYRGVGGAMMMINTGLLHTASLKLAPYMFLYLNIWGTYLVYVTICIFCASMIYRYIPETKGRSLKEIEQYYVSGFFCETSREFSHLNCEKGT